jgi:glycosyltransferase involved in cell wall biosynthesis
MTVLEAMAASKPIVATRVGAIPRVIRHGETGLLVNPRDTAGFKDALARLLVDPDLCRRMGAQARDWVGRHYTSDAMALQYRLMYDEVLGKQSVAGTVDAEILDRPNAGARSA